MTLTQTERDTLNFVSAQLGIPPEWLEDLIYAESGFDPQAKNPGSSARGLIQFIDSTAQELGFQNSLDLVTKYPTITTQLRTPVYEYLKRYMPFETKQSLYLAVFYPAARYKPPEWVFPANVQKANAAAGIDTVQSYMNFVDTQAEKKNPNRKGETVENSFRKLLIISGISAIAYLILKKSFLK